MRRLFLSVLLTLALVSPTPGLADWPGKMKSPWGVKRRIPIDSIAPTDVGVLSVTAGNQQNALSWSAATDNVGVTGYRVVVATGLVAPADCTGSAVYDGAALLTTHTSLTNLTDYTYRVCAYDARGLHSTGLTGTGYPAPLNAQGSNHTVTIGQYYTAADSAQLEHATLTAFGYCVYVPDIDSDDMCLLTKAASGAGNAEYGACLIVGSGASTTYIMSFFAGGAIGNFVRTGVGAAYSQANYRCFMASIDTPTTQAGCVYSVPNPVGGTPGSNCTVIGDCPGASVSACSVNQNRIRVWTSVPGTSSMTLTYATAVLGTVPASITPTASGFAIGALVGSTCIGGRTNCSFGSTLAGGGWLDQPWVAYGVDRATVTAAVNCLYPSGFPTMTPWRCFASGTRGVAYYFGDESDVIANPINRWPCGGSFPACPGALSRVGTPVFGTLPSPPY